MKPEQRAEATFRADLPTEFRGWRTHAGPMRSEGTDWVISVEVRRSERVEILDAYVWGAEREDQMDPETAAAIAVSSIIERTDHLPRRPESNGAVH